MKNKSRVISVILLVVAGVTLFLAQSAYWINHTVFNQANFTQITTEALLSESSREAIATSVVDKALADRPIVKRLIGERVISITSGLLGSDLSSQAVKTLTSKAYAYTTSSNRQDIKIDLTAVKAPLESIVTLAQTQGRGDQLAEAQNKLPNEIVLLESRAFPDLSGIVKTMLWLGPLFWLSSLVSFGVYIYLGRANYARKVYTAGFVVAGVALLGLVISPFIPAPVAAAVPNIELRTVAENLAVGFLAPFKAQMLYMLGFALLALLAFNQRFNILTAINAVGSRLSKKSAKKKR